MLGSEETQNRILIAIAVAAAGLIHISIAASQVCLGIGIALLLVFRRKLEFPRIWIPLAALFAWTILADVLSPDPWGGRAQIKKFFVFLFIPLMYSVFARQFAKVFWVMAAWTAAATASGLFSIYQFVQMYQAERFSPMGFYIAYLQRRVTGFQSHWMTFSALELSVLSLLLAQWFFSDRRMPVWVYSSIMILSAGILLAEVRSVWLAMVPAVIYLVWFWKPKMILLLPVVAAIAFLAAPEAARQRLDSLFEPHGQNDSNQHRVVTFRTGVRMIEAHPFLGLGPEQIKPQFDSYVPSDITRPLPTGYYGHLHSIYLQYAAERGIPAILFLLWMIGWTAWDCLRAIARAGKVRSQQLFLLHGTVAVIIGILIGGTAEYNLGDSEVLMMFTTVLGLAYAAVRNVNVQPVSG